MNAIPRMWQGKQTVLCQRNLGLISWSVALPFLSNFDSWISHGPESVVTEEASTYGIFPASHIADSLELV